MCELTDIPVRSYNPVGSEGLLDHISTAFALHSSVFVAITGFDTEGDNRENALFPAPGNECLLHIVPSDPEEWEPVTTDTSVRFFIDALPIFGSQPLQEICFLDGRLTADGRWEWSISCDGAPNCDRCHVETLLQCA